MGLCWCFCTNWGMGLDGRGISTLHRIIQQMDRTSSLDTVHLLTAKLSALNCELPFLSQISMQVATSKSAGALHVPKSGAQPKAPRPPIHPPSSLDADHKFGGRCPLPKGSVKSLPTGLLVARLKQSATAHGVAESSKAPPRLKPTSKAMPAAVKDEDVVIIYA